jgi:hypothetical protein
MPRRRLARTTNLEIARAQPFDVDVNRKKRIHEAVDYFGVGRVGVAQDMCGESLLDGSVS